MLLGYHFEWHLHTCKHVAVVLHQSSFVIRTYSQYYHGLDKDSKWRYDNKLNLIRENVDDSYTIPLSTQSSNHSEKWPNDEYPDIYNYLVNTCSPYTKDMLKAHKSLEGYKYITAGWVSNATLQELPGSTPVKVILIAKVKHSQPRSATLLQPWVAVESNDNVICAHCTCKAGLGEASLHIAAILFPIEAQTHVTKNTSCTRKYVCGSLQP